jgi:hypothetical protein
MNAQLALNAAGTMSRRGSTLAPMAAAASIGMSSAVVAVLLVISVKKVTLNQMTANKSIVGIPLSPASASPMI